MENRKSCPIEQALLRIEASAKSSRDLLNTFYFLQRTISNILTQSNDWRRVRILEKENEVFFQQLLNWKEVREFLDLIGFNDKDGGYNKTICDEGIKLLEATLQAINRHILDLKQASMEEKSYLEVLKSDDSGISEGNITLLSHDNQYEKGSSQSKDRCTKLKDMLSRHLKQDRPEKGSVSERKKRESSGSSFDAGGYFYQPCQKSDNKKRKCFFAGLFDKHDLNCKQKGTAFFSFLKLG